LAKDSHLVRIIVRDGKQRHFKHLKNIESTITTFDLFNESVDWFANACQGIDTVIHVAWYAEHGKYLQSPKNIDCLVGTINLARGAAKAGVRRFIGIGTCFEYDLSGGMISTDAPLHPLTPYAGAKAAAFMMLSQWLPPQKVEFAWCRLFYLHGEDEVPLRLVSYLRNRLAAGQPAELTTGTQIRDFLDIREAGRMIVDTAQSTVCGPVNVCSGTPITVRQLALNIADEYGRPDLLHFGVRKDNLFDPPCVVGIKGTL
jgi:dTDP-6-deoxy-L-talose 4-dehydrogenase (NAD+)